MKVLTLTIVTLVAFAFSVSANRETSKPDSLPVSENGVPTIPPPTPGLEGYCWPLSPARGERIDFYVSGIGSPEAAIVRAYPYGVSSPIRPPGFIRFIPTVQPTNPEPWRNGAGWRPSFSFTIPVVGWSSGIYAAELTDLKGVKSYITFIVRPSKRTGPTTSTIVIANVNTWLAYNNWGGRSKEDGPARLSFMRPNPFASPVALLGVGGHLTRGEVWLLHWLDSRGIKPSVYTDIDFDEGLVRGGDYQRLVLSTHPQYWTVRMYDQLNAFLAAGGSVVYLGGNGVYESGAYDFTADNKSMIFRGGVEKGPREPALFRRLSPPRPERAILGVATERCNVVDGPYEILEDDHPLFTGTDLHRGDLVGESGLNIGFGTGKAAGWFIDTTDGPGSRGIPSDCGSDTAAWPRIDAGALPPGLVVLARGQNWMEDGVWKGAEMTYYRHRCGGSVFSAGSTTFVGSLMVDSKLEGIIRNVFNYDIARELDEFRLGEDAFPWGFFSEGYFGRAYRISLTRLTFDDSCPRKRFWIVKFPLHHRDPLGRAECNAQLSVSFPPGLKITPTEVTSTGRVELRPLTTSPATFVRPAFSEVSFRVERLSAITSYNLTFDFVQPNKTICGPR